MAKQITCITKFDRPNPHERITHVGGKTTATPPWKITTEQAIADIKRDPQSYFTHVNQKSVWVVVAVSAHGNEYIKTQDDDERQNNLLSLPPCL